MIKLLLVRHGETLWNKQRRIQGGGSDIDLSEVGKKQVERLALSLRRIEVGAVYSSPLRRALDTAEIIASHHHLQVEVDSNLREIEAGEMEGVSLDAVGTNFSQFLIQWQHLAGSGRLPGGESLADLRNRAWSAIQHITYKQEQKVIVVVSHYFVILTTICQALGLPLSHLARFRINVSSLSILDFDDGHPCLVTLNDTCHLEEG